MTKGDLIKVLTEKIEKYEINEFFKLLANSIDTSKYDINSLEIEWEKTQRTESLGLFNQNQAIAAFKSFFIRYVKNNLEQLSDSEIKDIEVTKEKKKDIPKLVDKDVETKYKISSVSEKVAIENENNPDSDNKIGKRPIIITVLCIIGMISIFWNLFNLTRLNELKVQMNTFLVVVTIFQMLLHGLHLAGLWAMKKWNIIVYAINFIIGLIVELSGKISFTAAIDYMNMIIIIRIVSTLFYWTILGIYYKRMT